MVNPKQITPKGPSYLHGWSPDGNFLVFCGERNGEYDVYKIPSTGGQEVRLTETKGLDDGPEYTPDGKYIYFNSVRSGTMQIWRMKPDGKDPEQVTNDEFNNWFAHISPDGKWIVFISFLKEEVQPGIHPPYKHVYIRLMPFAAEVLQKLLLMYMADRVPSTRLPGRPIVKKWHLSAIRYDWKLEYTNFHSYYETAI